MLRDRIMHKQSSFVMSDSNPLESGILSDHVTIKAENLNDAKLITNDEFEKLYSKLAALEENEARIELLETEKLPFLFNSEQLAKFVQIPESIRTKINFISIVGPRLVDPRVKMDYFIGLFRYAEEKSIVEEVLKNRTQTMNAANFSKVSNGPGTTGGRSGGRGGGRGVVAGLHKRGTSDLASITGSISDSDEPRSAPAVAVDLNQLTLLSKSRSDPSFEGGLLQFKSADPLHLSGSKSLLGADSPSSITSRLSAPENCEDLEVERINTPAAPIQPITISARAPMAAKGASSKESKRPVSVSGNHSSSSPASSTSSGRYSTSGSRSGTVSEVLSADELDLAAAPSAATLKKLNRRLPSSNSLTAMLAAEAAASNCGQVVSGAAATAAMSLKSDGDDDVVNSSSWMRRSGAVDAAPAAEIGKGTVEKLRSSFAGVGSSPAAAAAGSASGRCCVSEDIISVSSSPLKDPSLPRPPKARWTQSISSASATMAVTAIPSPGVRPEVIVRRFSSTVPRAYGSEDGIATGSTPAAVGGAASLSVSNDIANRCAAVLKIDKAAFLALAPEGPVRAASAVGDEERYSFIELVRRNFTKEYEGLTQSDLEKYLVEDEFVKVFQKDKTQFYAQPRWKQMEQKKKSMLF